MTTTECPRCRKAGVQSRVSKRTQKAYLANVETYPSGASYFRSLHTREECAAVVADREARVARTIQEAADREATREQGIRGQQMILRYKSIFGADAVAANWTAIAARWTV